MLILRRGNLRPDLSRRELLRMATLFAGASAAVTLPGCSGPAAHSVTPDGGDDFDLPSLGGAPDTPLGRTIAAFADTVLPGAHRDPTGAPGAIDSGAVALFFDPSLPAAQYLPTLAAFLDLKAHDLFGGSFVQLKPSERDAVLDLVLASIDLIDFAVELVRLSFYSSPVGGEHLGYPGPNSGYVGNADFSFGVAMAAEITSDGNLP